MFIRTFTVLLCVGLINAASYAQIPLVDYNVQNGNPVTNDFYTGAVDASDFSLGSGMQLWLGNDDVLEYSTQNFSGVSSLADAINNDYYLYFDVENISATEVIIPDRLTFHAEDNFSVNTQVYWGYQDGGVFQYLQAFTLNSTPTDYTVELTGLPAIEQGETLSMRMYAVQSSVPAVALKEGFSPDLAGDFLRFYGEVQSATVSYNTIPVTPNTTPVQGGSASVLAGEGTTSLSSISTSWSQANVAGPVVNSSPTAGSVPLQVISDTLTFTGMQNGVDTFTLGMGYDDQFFIDNGYDELDAAANQFIFLAVWDPNTSTWVNAVDLNVNADGSEVEKAVSLSWSDFAAANGITDVNLSDYLGSWGFDTDTNTVWAVIDHNSDFAVIPEPASLMLLMAGMGALLRRSRR